MKPRSKSRQVRWTILAMGFALIVSFPETRAIAGPTFYTINPPTGGSAANATSVNSKWVVAGAYTTQAPNTVGFTLDSDGEFKSFAVPNASSTILSAINTAGTLAGLYDKVGATRQGFLYKSGVVTTITPPGSASVFNIYLAENDSVAGNYYDANFNLHGFLYTAGKYTKIEVPTTMGSNSLLMGLNSAGLIVGNYTDSNGNPLAYTYWQGKYANFGPPNSYGTTITGVNEASYIFGSYYTIPISRFNPATGFVVKGGVFKDIVGPGINVYSTFVVGVNNNGIVIGRTAPGPHSSAVSSFVVDANGAHAFVGPGTNYTIVRAINDGGVITGNYTDQNVTVLGSFVAYP